jgi:hypothetical protein
MPIERAARACGCQWETTEDASSDSRAKPLEELAEAEGVNGTAVVKVEDGIGCR